LELGQVTSTMPHMNDPSSIPVAKFETDR